MLLIKRSGGKKNLSPSSKTKKSEPEFQSIPIESCQKVRSSLIPQMAHESLLCLSSC